MTVSYHTAMNSQRGMGNLPGLLGITVNDVRDELLTAYYSPFGKLYKASIHEKYRIIIGKYVLFV